MLGGQAEFGLNWLDNTLATRDQGGEIINIAQVYTRSGMTEITWKDSGIDDIAELEGKKVGVWLGGNEHKLFAALNKNGLDPQSDVEIIAQPFDMNLFLNDEIDAAAAMTYNELAQVLEQENPDTGELYALDDLNVLKMSDLGTAHWRTASSSRATGSRTKTTRTSRALLKASFRGWVYCRDNQEECLQIVLENGPTLGEGHQRWQLNEVNDLIWPAPLGIGVMDPESWEITKQIAIDYGIVQNEPEDEDLPHRPRRGRDGRAQGRGRRRERRGLPEGRGRSDARRRVAMSVLIKGGRVVTATDDYVADVYVEDETVSLIGESLDVQADKVIDASGRYILPAASTRTRISTCPSAARSPSMTSSRDRRRPRSAGRRATSTSSSSRRA